MKPDLTADETLTSRRRYLILAALVLATTLYATTILVVSVILPDMQGSLSAAPDQIAWVMTFNIVATAVATPMTGWLNATFGRRNVMLVCMTGFTLATMMCGLVYSLGPLVLFRIIQGLAGAPLVPLAQAVILDVFPLHERSRATAIFGMGVVFGPVIGPPLGGYVADLYDWHASFLVLVPMGVLAVLALWIFLPDGGRERHVRLDWTGFLTLVVAMICMQLALDRGDRLDWFESIEVIVEAVVGGIAFYLFIAHSLTTTGRPFLDLRHLLDRNYATGLLLVTIYGMMNFLPMIMLPPMLQDLLGFPNAIIGTLLAWRGAGAVAAYAVFLMALSIGRLDPRLWMSLGFGVQAYSGWLMMGFDFNTGTETVALTSFMQGVAVALIWAPLVEVTFATLNPRFLAEASSTFHLLRNLGSSAFISVCVLIISRTRSGHSTTLGEFVSPLNEVLKFGGARVLWDGGSAAALARLGGEIGRQAAMIGYINAFTAYTILNGVAIVCLLTVRSGRG
jgi:DHA2 family multidrug resistance protein